MLRLAWGAQGDSLLGTGAQSNRASMRLPRSPAAAIISAAITATELAATLSTGGVHGTDSSHVPYSSNGR